MKTEDQIQFNINLSKFDRLTRNNNKPTKTNIMKTLNRLHAKISIFLFGNKSCMPNEMKGFI